jgi:hypothetical protein
VAIDSNDDVIIVWTDYRNGPSDPDIYAQKLNSSGEAQWGSDDVKVNQDSGTDNQDYPDIDIDSNGNAIVVWQDDRNGISNNSIYAQKLNSTGDAQWGSSDKRVNRNTDSYDREVPVVAVASNDKIYVGWNDERNGVTNSDIYAQLINSSGDPQWSSSDVEVNQNSDSDSQTMVDLVVDSEGNAIFVWRDARPDLNDDDIYMQKMNSYGDVLWGSNDVKVNQDSTFANQVHPSVAIDNGDNIMVVWQDSRPGSGLEDIYAQRLGNSATGRAYIFYGRSSWSTNYDASSANVSISGVYNGERFGMSVSGAGDVDGGNYKDILVGAPGYNGNQGRAYIFYGDGSIPTSSDSADKTFTGESSGDQFGFSVSNARDVDNDGNDDVIIGAPYNDDEGKDAGRAYIYLGGEQYVYVSSNSTTSGFITNYNNAKNSSDSGAYATLKEENISDATLWLWICDATEDTIYKVEANASLESGSEVGNVNISWENTGTTNPHGMALYNGYIWCVDYGTDNIEQYYPNNGTLVATHDISGFSGDARGFTYGGGYFWIGDSGDDNIYKVNASTFSMEDYIDCDLGYFATDIPTYLEGLAWRDDLTPERLIMTDPGEDKIYTIDITNLSSNTIPVGNVTEVDTQSSDPGGLGWDGVYFWITDDAAATIYKVDPSTGNNVDSFSWTPGAPTGIEAEYETVYNYKMDIEFTAENVASGDSYYLQLNYSVDGTETDFGVYVYNSTSSDWDDLGSQGNLTSTSFTTKDYNLNSNHRLSTENIRIRFVGRNETDDDVNSTLNIEYHRIKVTNAYLTLSGECGGDHFGLSVANVSDINQDGSYDDVIVGAPEWHNLSTSYSVVWGSSDKKVIQSLEGRQFNNNVVVDSNDNSIFVWEDDRNVWPDEDIFVQKFDPDGNAMWGPSDVKVNQDSGKDTQERPAMAIDSNDNIIVVWDDDRDNGVPTIYAQKLDSNGNALWGSSDIKAVQSNDNDPKMYPAVDVDSDGNAIVVWQDHRNGAPDNYDIYAQKLDADGNALWDSSDVKVNQNDDSNSQTSPHVAVDSLGNAIVVWTDYRNSDNDVYAQKLDSDGNALWGSSDIKVNQNTDSANQGSPSVVIDQDDYVIIVWTDYRNVTDTDIYAQKLDSDGAAQWGSEDVKVNQNSDSADQSQPDVNIDQNGNAIVVWEDERNGGYSNQSIYTQKLNSDGNALWGDSDVRVNQDSTFEVREDGMIAVDSCGNAIIAWEDDRGGGISYRHIYAQKLEPPSQGRAYIYNGGSPMDSTPDVNLTGENEGDKFGFSVHCAGDIDGDGIPDVIVGVPYWDNGATTDCGQILVFKGGSTMDTIADYVHNGTQANEHFGWSVSLAFKMDGGSYDMVVVGSPHHDGSTDTGEVEVLNCYVIPEYSTIIMPVVSVVVLMIMARKRIIFKKRKNSNKISPHNAKS